MNSKVKWLIFFQIVNDDWSVSTREGFCYAEDWMAMVPWKASEEEIIVRIAEASTGKVVYDYEEELRKNGEKINAIYAKKYNGNFRI